MSVGLGESSGCMISHVKESSMAPAYNLFFGTFIHLPRKSADGKHILEINHGVLWVSIADGKIKGFDWSVRDDSDLAQYLGRKNWVIDNGDGKETSSTKAEIFRAREERNEFFFPGFIGLFFILVYAYGLMVIN